MSIAKHNRNINKFNIDTRGYEFRKLASLYESHDEKHVYPVYGLYTSRGGKYGMSCFAASDGYMISLPSHLVDTVQDILADDESINQINDHKAGLVIRPYQSDDGATHYSADFVDME